MKAQHRLYTVVGFAVSVFVWLASAAQAADDTVVNSAKRLELLTQARSLLSSNAAPLSISDPFHSEAFALSLSGSSGAQTTVENQAVHGPVGPRTARDLLQSIAASLKPSGYFVLGGQPTLVFGQKRVKAGSPLTITFEGTEYTLEIVSIDRPNFTLRLNREEFTRPIK